MEQGAGWRFFAGTVLGIAGLMRLFDAIWAWTYHGALPSNLEDAIFGHSLKTYGWIDFIVALILIGSSIWGAVPPLGSWTTSRRPGVLPPAGLPVAAGSRRRGPP